MRVRSAAAPRHAPAIARAAAVAAAAPCAALLDGMRVCVVVVGVACAGPLAPAYLVLHCLQCAESSGIEALHTLLMNCCAVIDAMLMIGMHRLQLMLAQAYSPR